jgi:hypothetical protein
MHPSVQDFVARVLTAEHIAGKSVLEVGSYDVNGSVRPYIESFGPKMYHGVDMAAGPRVDQVVDCEQLSVTVGYGAWDIVISTEMLEHVRDWRACMLQLSYVTKLGGLLLITTRSPGFPYHPFPEDHWRYTNDQMRAVLGALQFEILALEDDDKASPGVFALARRPFDEPLPHRPWAALRDLEVESAING